MYSYDAEYRYTALLPRGWEADPIESRKQFLNKINKAMNFIQKVASSEVLAIDEIEITFSIKTSLLDKSVDSEANDVSTD